MKIKLLAIIILLSFGLEFCNSQIMTKKGTGNYFKLEYSDGSGNDYVVTTDSISYFPIKPEMSSSGFYDGGEEKHVAIGKDDFDNLVSDFALIFENKKIHIKDRIKTSGLLIRYTTKSVEKVIISKSPEQAELEKKLKSLLAD